MSARGQAAMRTMTQFKTAIGELRRRKVFKVGSLYLIVAWGASLGVADLFPAFGVPDWGVRAFVIAAFLGFPLAVVCAWAFEITPQGVVRDPGPEPRRPHDDEPLPIEDTTISATTRSDSQVIRVSWQGGQRGHTMEFQRDFIIGREAEADIRLLHNKISRQHARVHFERGRWWLTDLDSRNGTYLNGTLVAETSPLNATNEITLSKGGPVLTVSVFQMDGETVLDDG